MLHVRGPARPIDHRYDWRHGTSGTDRAGYWRDGRGGAGDRATASGGGVRTDRGEGHVVLVSSLSGKSTTPVTSLYNATKFGLRGFALALRADWQPRGVGVSCINPGPIAEAGMFVDGGGTVPPGVRQRSPEDV